VGQFVAFSPRVEVNGETVLSIVSGLGVFKSRALEILSSSGIPDPQPGQWFSQQSWLDAFKRIAEKLGSSTLFQIGKAIPANAQWPPSIDSIEKALASIDVAYHMNHRGGEIGHYTFTSTGEESGKMVCNNPYPCDFDRGIIAAVAEKFKLQGSIMVKVKHDESAPCRNKGGDSCTYLIEW
jgi:hypothetical protein